MHLWAGIKVCKNSPILTHLHFADDHQSLHNIKMDLILFQLTSGVQINFHKSEILGINVVDARLASCSTRILCCKVGHLPLSYLGLPHWR